MFLNSVMKTDLDPKYKNVFFEGFPNGVIEGIELGVGGGLPPRL